MFLLLVTFCAAALVLTGCASNPPNFPEVADASVPAPASNSAVATPVAAYSPLLTPTLTNSPATTSTNLTDALDDKRELSVGDRISFRIVEDNDDPKPLVVTDSGDVEVPYLGLRPVSGKTCKQLAMEIKKDLEAKYYYHATVIISVDSMSRSLGRVYASGAVRTPGPLEIPGDEVFTLSKAVLRAGGFTDFADTHNVKVTRQSVSGGTNQTFTVDVGQILEKGRTALDVPLDAGDMIYVAERVIRF